MDELPRTPEQTAFVAQARREISAIIQGDDPRLMVVVGPCSIHDLAAGREYAERLRALADELNDRMLVLMRVYFEKPRTTLGWKGLIMDPHLNGTYDIPAGLPVISVADVTVVEAVPGGARNAIITFFLSINFFVFFIEFLFFQFSARLITY